MISREGAGAGRRVLRSGLGRARVLEVRVHLAHAKQERGAGIRFNCSVCSRAEAKRRYSAFARQRRSAPATGLETQFIVDGRGRRAHARRLTHLAYRELSRFACCFSLSLLASPHSCEVPSQGDGGCKQADEGCVSKQHQPPCPCRQERTVRRRRSPFLKQPHRRAAGQPATDGREQGDEEPFEREQPDQELRRRPRSGYE